MASKASKLNRARIRRRRRDAQRRRARSRQRTISIVANLDGSPIDEDCACPICAQMAADGVPAFTLGPNGELVQMPPPAPPPMMSVRVRGDASVWPHVPAAPRDEALPVGCVAHDFLEYLCFRDESMRRAFPPGALVAYVDGVPCEPHRVLMPGDDVVVTAAG